MPSHDSTLPSVTPWLFWGFERYVARYLRKHFHAVRIANESLDLLPTKGPILIYANHPGWWDPLMAVALRRKFWPEHRMYTPIDQQALEQYPLFRRLGFYGVQSSSTEGAKRFLRVTSELMQQDQATVWITPEGRFSDARRPVKFQPGLGHLAHRLRGGHLLPLAIEYVFWAERTPEALLQLGPAERLETNGLSKSQWTERLEARLEETKQSLAAKSMARDEGAFTCLLSGSLGVGLGYDLLRRVRASLRGERFEAGHSLSLKKRREAV